MARIAFFCCHLSGTGHLVRTLRLARAALRLGHEVVVISGGRPLSHLDPERVRIVQIPPVTVDGLDFGRLTMPDGATVTGDYRAGRMRALVSEIGVFVPDVLVTELFPFGRRMLADEFLAAINAAEGALILSSVRDIPEPKPKRIDEAAARLRAHYQAVLVHGDATLVPLEATWPLPGDVRGMVHHTGYVAPPAPAPAPRGGTVLVATGGGVLGRYLVEAAVAAAALSDRPWHVLVGGPEAAALSASLPGAPNLTVEPARADYRTLVARAGCSVSLCGYNTAVELAGLSVPAVLVPSAEGDEQEQTLRARALARYPGIEVMAQADLTPARLARVAERLAAGPPRPAIPLRADDGTGAIRRIEALLEERP